MVHNAWSNPTCQRELTILEQLATAALLNHVNKEFDSGSYKCYTL